MSVETWRQASTDRDSGINFAAYIQFRPANEVAECVAAPPTYVELSLQTTASSGARSFRLTSSPGFTPLVAMPRDGIVLLRVIKFCQRDPTTTMARAPTSAAHTAESSRAALNREDTFLSVRRAYTIAAQRGTSERERFVTLGGGGSSATSTFVVRLSYMDYPKNARSMHVLNVLRAFRIAIYFDSPLALLPSLQRRAHSLVALFSSAFHSHRIAFKCTPWSLPPPTAPPPATDADMANLDDVNIDIGVLNDDGDDDDVVDVRDSAAQRLVVGVLPAMSVAATLTAGDDLTRAVNELAAKTTSPSLCAREHWHFRLVADFYDMAAHVRDDIGTSEVDISANTAVATTTTTDGRGGAQPFATFALPLKHNVTSSVAADAASLDDAMHTMRVTFEPLRLTMPLAIPLTGRVTFRLERRYCTCTSESSTPAADTSAVKWIGVVTARRIEYSSASALRGVWQAIGSNYVGVNTSSKLWSFKMWIVPPKAPPTGVDDVAIVDLASVDVVVHSHYTLAANEADRPLFAVESYVHYGGHK